MLPPLVVYLAPLRSELGLGYTALKIFFLGDVECYPDPYLKILRETKTAPPE